MVRFYRNQFVKMYMQNSSALILQGKDTRSGEAESAFPRKHPGDPNMKRGKGDGRQRMGSIGGREGG